MVRGNRTDCELRDKWLLLLQLERNSKWKGALKLESLLAFFPDSREMSISVIYRLSSAFFRIDLNLVSMVSDVA